MAGMPFWIVDVFGYGPFSGNQLAVFLDGDSRLDGSTMLAMAREMGFSETTFMVGRGERGDSHRVRVFTPAMEVPFAGHPTLGTAHVLWSELGLGPVEVGEPIVLGMDVGRIPVEYIDDNYWMTQVEPVFGDTLDPVGAASALGLDVADLDLDLPVLEVSTGLPHIIVPLKDLECLVKARPEPGAHSRFLGSREARNIMAFCTGGHPDSPEPPAAFAGWATVSTRMFAHDLGIVEDAATGSGSGCLAAYHYKLGLSGGGPVRVLSEQGFEMGRPSLLLLEAEGRNGGIRVRVGGKAVTMARGEFRI